MRFWVGIVSLLVAATAQADDAADAKAHYQSGTTHYAVGEFAEAAAEYEAAYKLKPDPALLFNAAQARRFAGDNEKARILYKNYLQLYPKAKNASEVRDQIAKLDELIVSGKKTAPPKPVEAPPKPDEPPPEVKAPPPPPAVAPAAVAPSTSESAIATSRPERTPVYKKWWLWTIVGVVAAAAVVVPVVLVETATRWANVSDQGPGAPALMVRW